ncbi:outer membrane efflux protein [Bacteriovorax sp. BSW11_IV]|uniref:TolC family protein n=1 Tax=Bacteriovorax sp. BSW11_IV TaxID=1353529 RepID=UPI00038A0D10|nr:TolC family protein [Bacteriovorax sp. BSW11_IV]EQC48858.1 outer membrane efflux protein [Bacteriovorax sp. BSW11_IV]
MKPTTLVMLLSLPGLAYGQRVELNLDKAIELALKNNEGVAISGATLEKAETQISKARSGLFPTLKFEYNVVRTRTTPVFQNTQDAWYRGPSITATQPVYTFGRLSSAIDLAKSQKSLYENDFIATKANIEKIAKTFYYSALFNQELLEITQSSYDNASKNNQALKKRVSYGRISRNENLKMQADLASRKPRYIEAQKVYETAKIDLANFLGLDPKTEIVFSDKLVAKTRKVKSSNNENFENLAQVRVLSDSIAMSKSLESIAKSDHLPTLALFGSYSPTTYYDDFFSNEIRDQKSYTFGLKLTFDLPLGGEKFDEVAIKKVETRIAELRYQAGKRQIESRVITITKEYEKLLEKLDASKTAVSLAQDSYKVALSSFSTGSISQTQLNDSELLLTSNKIEYAQNILQLHLLSAELDELLTEGTNGGIK